MGKTTQSKVFHRKKEGNLNKYTQVNHFYTYDHADRLLKHTQKINNDAVELIAYNKYNELGQLVQKKVGGTKHTTNVTYSSMFGLTNTNGVIQKTLTSSFWTAGFVSTQKIPPFRLFRIHHRKCRCRTSYGAFL